MDQLWSVALILKSVIEEGVAHSNLGLLLLGFDKVLKLLVPHPVCWLHTRSNAGVLRELVDHVDVVNDVEN